MMTIASSYPVFRVASSGSEQSEEEGEVVDDDEDQYEPPQHSRLAVHIGGSAYDSSITRTVTVNTLKRPHPGSMPHPTTQVSHINPEEIPDVPKNRFLYRGLPDNRDDPAAREDGNQGKGGAGGRDPGRGGRDLDRGGRVMREVDERGRERVRGYAGGSERKKVKGRGAVVSYRDLVVRLLVAL